LIDNVLLMQAIYAVRSQFGRNLGLNLSYPY
jgi:hypothetical protein